MQSQLQTYFGAFCTLKSASILFVTILFHELAQNSINFPHLGIFQVFKVCGHPKILIIIINNNKAYFYTAPKSKSLGATVSINQTKVSLVVLWTVRSPLQLAVQPANCSRLVGWRLQMIRQKTISVYEQKNWTKLHILHSHMKRHYNMLGSTRTHSKVQTTWYQSAR